MAPSFCRRGKLSRRGGRCRRLLDMDACSAQPSPAKLSATQLPHEWEGWELSLRCWHALTAIFHHVTLRIEWHGGTEARRHGGAEARLSEAVGGGVPPKSRDAAASIARVHVFTCVRQQAPPPSPPATAAGRTGSPGYKCSNVLWARVRLQRFQTVSRAVSEFRGFTGQKATLTQAALENSAWL